MKDIAQLADRLAKRLCPSLEVFEELRDAIDLRTGGDLDTVELDILTDAVEVRLRKKLAGETA